MTVHVLVFDALGEKGEKGSSGFAGSPGNTGKAGQKGMSCSNIAIRYEPNAYFHEIRLYYLHF